ncbi:MAG: sulfurtransferase FdhD, partial [Acidimicrobiia bacterium]|nr:sulfurtransferase FdhD [Acidimicrobiia bacterium]
PEVMAAAQAGFAATGGIHAAAIFEPDGNLIALREDIGRHNAVDKVIGYAAKRQWPIGEVVLVVSGRVSFEMVQKAAVAGIPIVAGVSAASSLAVELGEELGMTVIGFLREESCNVYTDAGRIAEPAAKS